ncbi:PAS domain S-box protein [Geomonas sp. RF6]|uniref:PAS domain-containing protein n=1 Tax=Geomonas sp. RF6 TaxID=2897342 RepID=UPI001E63EF0F|nr:PAS domain-containing protein [Geomonas sp. RF6]UFS69964.1 PAS domain S-box protein [Geomonas sp. RF6]
MAEVKPHEMALLYVEDDACARERMVEELGRRYPGLRIHQAANGAEGVSLFLREHPDVVITDLIMPVMDGISFAERIKSMDEDAVIIALTASNDTEYLVKAIDVGINGYLLKPLSYEKLFALLDRKFKYLSLKKELNRKNEHLRKLSWAVEHSPVSVVISDRDGTIEYVNLKFQELTGFSADEVVGMNVSLQKSGQTPVQTYQELWRTISAGQVWQGEFLNRKKNGELYWEHASVAPIFSDSGEVSHYVAIKEDITQHRHMVRALEKSQHKFATLFGAVPALILISTTSDLTVVEANESFLQTMEYQRQEIVGHVLGNLPVWEGEAERGSVLRAVSGETLARNLEIRLRTRSGNTIVGLLSTATFELDERSFIMSVIRDITERKEREAEIELLNARLAARAADLEHANRELEAFNSMIAHDLRNPLNVINSYSQIVREMCGEGLDPTCQEYLEETYNGTLRMNRLIDALLDFSRLAHAQLARQPVDLSAIATEVAAELRYLAPACRVAVEIAEGVVGNCDASLLRIVLQNLLGNAMKYNCTKDTLRVEFGATLSGGKSIYFVRDNGIGFNTADAGKIFQPFHRLPGPGEVEGHGIGLATVERIIRRHGGRVWAEGEVGKGASFFFTLEPDEGAAAPVDDDDVVPGREQGARE